ncbi:MAG: hypothetical protein PF489_03135 [Salinivirgaceae bacterium]|jgi:hypothetical protein|nr:hypothetical protein [Salinivirgaceae bacterium]
MERNANHCKVAVFIFVMFAAIVGYGQGSGEVQEYYSQLNVELDATFNKFNTDSIDYKYDIGFGAAIEKEYYLTDKFVFMVNGGLQMYHSSGDVMNFSRRILALQAKAGAAYYFLPKTAIYGGPVVFYSLVNQYKGGLASGWKKDKGDQVSGIGAFAGLSFYINSWFTWRLTHHYTSKIQSTQISLVITPSAMGK